MSYFDTDYENYFYNEVYYFEYDRTDEYEDDWAVENDTPDWQNY